MIDDYELNSSYKSNPLLKPAGTKYSYTKSEIDEFIKCKNDPIYFIETYIKVVHIDRGLVPLKLYDFQKEMITSFWKNRQSIVLASRQIGKTTVSAAFFVWFTIFNEEQTCAILANKAAIAREILSRYQKAYENLPKFLQQGVVTYNRMSVELENGSRVFAASTSSTAIRGYAISCVLLDEFAHVGRNVADDFFTSVWPTLSSGKESKMLITSTPNGFNHFYKIWNEAEQDLNGFNPIFVHWSKHPDRDEKWKQHQLSVLGEEKFAQEMEAEFLGSANTLIHSRDLKRMSPSKPVHASEGLRIYETPVENNKYLIVCDPARGTGGDNSAFIVFDITQYPITIAATYSDSNISPLILPSILERMGKTYNNAHVLVELNDNGEQVSTILWKDHEYENTVIFNSHSKKPSFGVRTTKKVKSQGCTLLKGMVAENKLIVNDIDLIYEMSNFVATQNTYKAAPGFKDDLTMCCVLLSWFCATSDFTNLTNTNYKKDLLNQKNAWIDEDVLPWGFVSDGIQDLDEEEKDFWGEGVTWVY